MNWIHCIVYGKFFQVILFEIEPTEIGVKELVSAINGRILLGPPWWPQHFFSVTSSKHAYSFWRKRFLKLNWSVIALLFRQAWQ